MTTQQPLNRKPTMSNNKQNSPSNQAASDLNAKTPVQEKSEALNTTPPPPTESDNVPFSGISAAKEEVTSEPSAEPVIVTDNAEKITLSELLASYEAGMGRLVHYDRDTAIGYQTLLVRAITDWAASAKYATNNGVDFIKTARTLAAWFAENIEGCCDPQLIYRGLVGQGTPLRNEAEYKRYTAICGLFYRLATKAQHSILSGDPKQIQDHFKDITVDAKFIDLISEAIQAQRI